MDIDYYLHHLNVIKEHLPTSEITGLELTFDGFHVNMKDDKINVSKEEQTVFEGGTGYQVADFLCPGIVERI